MPVVWERERGKAKRVDNSLRAKAAPRSRQTGEDNMGDGFGNRTTWCSSQQLQPYELPSFAALIRIGSG
jgi:hypothetical protein